MNLEQFKKDGVILLKGVLKNMAPLIAEYDSTVPTITEIPKHQPIVVFWKHVIGERKKISLLDDMPVMKAFASQIADIVRQMESRELRLLETIIFNKPPGISNVLSWHQDLSFFPFRPNNQLSVWIPFDKVTKESGAMVYAIGTHLMALRASTDLHSGNIYSGDDRTPIPMDMEAEGITTRVMEMDVGDMLIHDGRTWHMSGPNRVEGQSRRGLSLRFLVGDTFYEPRAGSAAAFLQQIDIKPGDKIDDPAFPVL